MSPSEVEQAQRKVKAAQDELQRLMLEKLERGEKLPLAQRWIIVINASSLALSACCFAALPSFLLALSVGIFDEQSPPLLPLLTMMLLWVVLLVGVFKLSDFLMRRIPQTKFFGSEIWLGRLGGILSFLLLIFFAAPYIFRHR